MLDGMMFGESHVPPEYFLMDASSGVTINAEVFTDGPGAESVSLDGLRIMHMMPSPGLLALGLLALLVLGRRRR
jgi:uncharacterized protein (TIGR03382 family)